MTHQFFEEHQSISNSLLSVDHDICLFCFDLHYQIHLRLDEENVQVILLLQGGVGGWIDATVAIVDVEFDNDGHYHYGFHCQMNQFRRHSEHGEWAQDFLPKVS